MTTHPKLIALALIVSLPVCTQGDGGGRSSNGAEPKSTKESVAATTPHERLAEIVSAYDTNSIRGKHSWGGKAVTIAGTLTGTFRKPDGSIEISIRSARGVAFATMPSKQEAYIAVLDEGADVELNCTVDPVNESVAKFIGCEPDRKRP